MQSHQLPGVRGATVEIDVCFECQGLWFDAQENLKLSAEAVVTLFRLMHAHRDAPRLALAPRLACPRCQRELAQGFDVVKSGRYITHRCPQRHGRFSVFASFMIEKGFVRQLSGQEIKDLAQRLQVVHCSNCGAPVDLRQHHACPYCKAAFSLLDPQAVERALHGYARAAQQASAVDAPSLADALIQIERDRAQALRDAQQGPGFRLQGDTSRSVDLLGLGLGLIAHLLR
ncbi:MAG: hypothetical protein OHK0048_20420 [Rhodoferax sp.]